MKQLRMTLENIEKIKAGKKTLTTRTHKLEFGLRELVSGSYYKPIRSGMVVDLKYSFEMPKAWTLKESSGWPFQFKVKFGCKEGFESWGEFITYLKKVSSKKISDSTPLYTYSISRNKEQELKR